MSVPHEVLAAGWIPFVIVSVLILLFSFVYIHCHQHRTDGNVCSTIMAFLGLAVALATCALVPVDIFLVSFMKNSDGQFKPWAKDPGVRESIEDGLVNTYYVLYGLMVLFLFFLLPFAFFYCEDAEESATVKWRCCNALKFSLIFVLMAVVLFVIGAFVPFAEKPLNGTSEWEEIKNIFIDLETTHAENAISFMMSALTLVGMLPLILYLGCGMAIWPMDLLKGRRSVQGEYEEVEDQRSTTRAEADSLRSRQSLSRRDRRRVEELDERERMIQRQERHLQDAGKDCWRRCSRRFMRPFEIVFGVLFLLLALLVFVSLLLTDIDKVMNSLGPLKGYILPSPHLPNPIDILLVLSQQVFPLDYILIIGLTLFLFLCAMSAIKMIGIWFCWVRMYKIRLRRTRPQGLLLLCFLLMVIVLAMNVLIYEMAPQYGKFGSQKYIVNQTTLDGNVTQSVIPCTTKAPNDECIMTRMSMLLFRFIYKLWFFGAAYYWASWIFLGMFLLALVISAIRKRRSSVAGEIDENEFDSDDEDDPMIRA